MILAVIGGVRGNVLALDAVLDAVDAEGIERILCTGDVAVGYPWPNECIDRLVARAIPCVQGQSDRYVVRVLRKEAARRRRLSPQQVNDLAQAFHALDSRNLEYLRGLPKSTVVTVDGIDMMLCHGTPANPNEALSDTDNDQHFRRQREVSPAPIIVHGATDRPHVRMVDGTLFVNPGALGNDAERAGYASYAIVSTENEPWEAEIRFAPYDAEAAHAARSRAREHDPS